MKITLKESHNGYRFVTNVHIVRGIGKRSIRVVVRPFFGEANSEESLITLAAMRAAKMGWKTIVVMPGCINPDGAYTMSWTQYIDRYSEQFERFLCYAKDATDTLTYAYPDIDVDFDIGSAGTN